MAVVPNLGGVGRIDRPLSKPNRTNAGTPFGALTPAYPGEMVLDSTTAQLWVASGGLTTTSWIPVTKVY